jgi:transposase
MSAGAGVTIRHAATTLGVSVKFIRNLLSLYRDEFPERVYGRADGQRVRLLSAADVARLADCLARWREAWRHEYGKPGAVK